jgi:ribosome modulation factor
MNAAESQMYDLGRQARQAGYERGACNVRDPIKRSFWLAGWHDQDMEELSMQRNLPTIDYLNCEGTR